MSIPLVALAPHLNQQDLSSFTKSLRQPHEPLLLDYPQDSNSHHISRVSLEQYFSGFDNGGSIDQISKHEVSSEPSYDEDSLRLAPDHGTSERSIGGASSLKLLDVDPKLDLSEANSPRHSYQPPQLTSRWLHHYLHHGKPWLLELLSWISSFIAFGAIVIILKVYDGEPIPRWHFGITLNTLVSILATIGTITLGTPIAAALGQLKWTWYHHHQPVADFDTIDQASRGFLGSARLLLKRRGGFLAYVGAIMMILTFAIHPFIQQIINYNSIVIVAGTANLPTALILNSTNIDLDRLIEWFATDFTMTGSFYSALFANPTTIFNVTVACSTNNCTWHDYQTLAVCSSCQDISNHITTSGDTNPIDPSQIMPIYTLPNNLNLTVYPDAPPGAMDLTQNFMVLASRASSAMSVGSDEILQSVAYPEAGSILGGFFTIADGANATECILQYCVKTFTAKYTNSSLVEVELSRWMNDSVSARSLHPNTNSYDAGLYNLTQYTLTPPNQHDTFSITSLEYIALLNTFGYIFDGSVSGEDNAMAFSNAQKGGLLMLYSSEAVQKIYETLSTGGIDALSTLMTSVADSLTLNIRQRPGTGIATGTAYAEVLVLQVVWFWLIFPWALLLLCLAFLVLVIFNSARSDVRVWKSSALATLFHGLDESTLAESDLFEHINAMEAASDTLVVRLAKGSTGWKLAGVSEGEL